MALDESERRYLNQTRVGHLATANDRAEPAVVPICFGLVNDRIVSAIDEKPQTVEATDLRRVRDIRDNSRVALIADRYREDWSNLSWLQIRGRAGLLLPADEHHGPAVRALRDKYDQYREHNLEERPVIRIEVNQTVSWGLAGD